MQIVSIGDNLHEMSKPIFRESKKNISVRGLLKILPRVLSVKPHYAEKGVCRYFKLTAAVIFLQSGPSCSKHH